MHMDHIARIFGIGVDKQEVSSLVEPLGCKLFDLPFTYLGVPVGANMKYKRHWAPVIERFQSRLNLWKSKTLSLGAVLGSLPTFYFSLFVAPTGVIKKLESIRRRFLWGGAEEQKKINWVSWKFVTAPKEIGGLGLGSLKVLNLSLITKWIWRLKVDSSGLWSKVIKAGVQDELKLFDIDMEEIMMKKIGSGEETMFWLDKWIGDSTLKTSFPEAYNLKCNKHYKISDRLQNGFINWEWKSAPRTPELVSEINLLASRIRDFQIAQGNDKWVCTLSSDGIFHVDRLRIQIDRWNLPTLETPLKWIHEIPLKVTCFMWRANLEKIPTACALLKRGIQLTSPICSYCENAEEDAYHVLFRCPMAAKVWEWVLSWCDLPNVHFESIEELLKFTAHWGTCEKKRRNLISICYGTT
uniref:Reverse transcriptase zinc-binding domain-containing protein n=1 Tax=Lactuca sativa TaxID=4236 RepID=A0A9R1W2S8_LACSA|nr:hypothetical protein LSAT_V11C300123840 [Lactuca sativa]